MCRAYISSLLLLALVSLSLNAQSTDDRKALIQDVVISGVQTIGTAELNDIKGALTATVVNDDKEEIGERLRMAFQDHGYFATKVNSVRIRVSDPLANPKPVTVEAEVSEGPLFHIGEVKFKGNEALASGKIGAEFPIKKNDIFTRGKTAAGLEAIREDYVKIGYLDCTVVPETITNSTTIDIVMDINEGHQYHFGSVEFAGDSSLAEKLRPRWELEAGQPFDATYTKKFFDDNQSLLPLTVDINRAITLARDCDKHLVTVLIDLDPQHPSQRPPKDSGCDQHSEGTPR